MTPIHHMLGALLVGIAPQLGAQLPQPVTSLPDLDLVAYAGLWHEVARLPNRFEKACVAATTAEYTLLDDHTIKVVNRCRTASGSEKEAVGKAKPADAKGPPSRLKVRFAPAILSFLPMVWGDYWVLALADSSRAALVGTPDRKYLWVLARDSVLDDTTYELLMTVARSQGFDVSKVVRQR